MKYFAITGAFCASLLFTLANAGAQTPVVFRAVDQLPPQLLGQPMSAFEAALGSRLTTQGLARTILSGTLSVAGSPDTPITVVRQNPGRIQIVQGTGPTALTSVVNQQTQTATAGISGNQEKLVETLLFDCADFILFDHANFGGTRYLGAAYPYPRAAVSARFAAFAHPTNIGLVAAGVIRNKRFYFNQATGLLEYVVSPAGPSLAQAAAQTGETAITWQKNGTQQFPASITHWEAGVETFAIHFTQVNAGPSATDNTFTP